MRKWRALLFGLFLILGVLFHADASAKAVLPEFDLEAHRGGRDERPENTLAAFRGALDLGVSTLELDLQMTKDGVLVVSHNDRLVSALTRDENGAWLKPGQEPKISSLTLEELRRNNVGGVNPASGAYWTEHGASQAACEYQAVPTLAEVFELVRNSGNDAIVMNIETKSYATRKDNWPDPETFVKKVLEVVDAYGMENRIVLQSFDWRTLVEMKRQRTGITLSALTDGQHRKADAGGKYPWLAGINLADYHGNILLAAMSLGVDIISPEYHEVTEIYIESAHGMGLKVIPWTVDDPEEMERLMRWGVDGLITDRPALLRKIITAQTDEKKD